MTNPAPQPLVPLLDRPTDPGAAAQLDRVLAKTGRIINLHRMLAYSPVLFRTSSETVMAMREGMSVSRATIELAILRTAHVAPSDYEWLQHVPMALQAGIRQAQIDAVQGDWRASAAFDDAERAILALTDATLAGRMPDETDADLIRQHHSAQQIVELVLIIGQYLGTARFIAVLGIPPEPTS